MSKLFKIRVSDGTEMIGRLVGFINKDECKAILNSDDAPKRISTSESVQVSDHIGHIEKSRFVLVVRKSLKEGYELPAIFISPEIRKVSWVAGNAQLHCKDRKTYTFEKGEVG